jgi:hypothetical protein
MSDQVCCVEYVYVLVKNKPGEGAKILGAIRDRGINLLAFSGFPARASRAQIDIVTDEMRSLQDLAQDMKWKLSKVKKGFLVHGDDRIGAVADIICRLSKAKVNITAVDAVSAGEGRFGMILWVKAASYKKAAKVLGAS